MTLIYVRKIRFFFKQNFSKTTDEEISGPIGLKMFVKTNDFKALNIGFSLDEGIASPTDDFPVFYAERAIWHVEFKCKGNAGHGSLLHKDTAGEKIDYLISKFMEFRRHEVFRLESNPSLTIGDVTTVNLTRLNGGKQSNVVPPSLTVTFDLRLANDVSHDVFMDMVNILINFGNNIIFDFLFFYTIKLR